MKKKQYHIEVILKKWRTDTERKVESIMEEMSENGWKLYNITPNFHIGQVIGYVLVFEK